MIISKTNFHPCYDCNTGACCISFNNDGISLGPQFSKYEYSTFRKHYPGEADFHKNGALYSPLIKEESKCPFLGDKGCKIYDHRPIDCRIFPFTLLLNNGLIATIKHGVWLVLVKNFCNSNKNNHINMQNFIDNYADMALDHIKQYDRETFNKYAEIEEIKDEHDFVWIKRIEFERQI